MYILKKTLSYFKMKNVFGIVGWSGSGKTHLICRIIKYFDKKKINICSIKHSHHNFEIDKKGKDSYDNHKAPLLRY